MGIGEIGANTNMVNTVDRPEAKRVLGKHFNVSVENIDSGIRKTEPLMSFKNPATGESVEIHRSDVYSEDVPLYILKGVDAEGVAFEKELHAWMIDTRNCSYAELMVLNAETGNNSLGDRQRMDILQEKAGVKNYLDKADYSAAAKKLTDDYKKSGNWDSYLAMDKWTQSINDYTSVPVYFDRDLMEGNGIGNCSFGTVKTAEEIQKEIDDRIKAGEKNYPSLREVLASTYPNAERLMYRVAGSSKLMNFDEYVKDTEEMLRKLWENS